MMPDMLYTDAEADRRIEEIRNQLKDPAFRVQHRLDYHRGFVIYLLGYAPTPWLERIAEALRTDGWIVQVHEVATESGGTITLYCKGWEKIQKNETVPYRGGY